MIGVALLPFLLCADQLIAASGGIDHPALALDQHPAPAVPPGLQVTAWAAAALAPVVIALVIWRRWYRLRAVPLRPLPFTPLMGGALFIAMILLGIVGSHFAQVAWAIDFPAEGEPFPLADQAKLSLGAYGGQAVAVALFAWARHRAEGLERLKLGTAVLIGAGGLLLVYPMFQAAAIGAEAVARYLWGETAPPLAHDTLASLVASKRDIWFVITLALVIVAAPIVEEVMYRGLLQETLRLLGLSRWLAILTTSALFAGMHLTIVEPYALVPLFVLSVGLGWAYEKSGRLTAPVTMHLLFNVANLTLAFLFVGGESGGA